MYPGDYKYTKEHEWVRVEGTKITIGITQFAQQQLGEIVFVEFPEVGSSLNQSDEMGTLESVKAVAEYYAPSNGKVIEINETVREDPELLNEDPHGEGWLVKLQITNASQLKGLMSAQQYEEFIKSEEQ
jgi:glycine cleavage system H protein